MDREPGLTRARVAGALLALAAGCAAPRTTLPAGARVLARGSLAYAVAASPRALVTIELEERFALVVREPDGTRVRARHDLGPAEHDLPALAVVDELAWVGGDDQVVRAVALASGREVARWPVGADVTALAADPTWVAIGDTTGVVCLRRRADAALVHCLAGPAPVTHLQLGPGAMWVWSGTTVHALTVPALATSDAAPPPLRWRGQDLRVEGRVVHAGGRALVRLGERIRAITIAPDGALVVAGWVARLDDPAVVRVPAR